MRERISEEVVGEMRGEHEEGRKAGRDWVREGGASYRALRRLERTFARWGEGHVSDEFDSRGEACIRVMRPHPFNYLTTQRNNEARAKE